ncbi:MAG TPA: hypothetical protein VD908_19280 [Cytophagales bacterium]|nr:hypothetical protein [Cytophagales bacterium]
MISKKRINKSYNKLVNNHIESLLKETNQHLEKGNNWLEHYKERNHLQFYNLLVETLK